MPIIQYNPEIAKMTYGLFICSECNSQFYGGGEALHNAECKSRGYSNCIYCFGNKETWKLVFHLPYLPTNDIIEQAKQNPEQNIQY